MAQETDPHRLEQRQKQVDFGLATIGYANYVYWLKTNKGRVKPIPIPNVHMKCSKRNWDGQIRHWRRLLHLWDTTPPTGSGPELQNFEDPCAHENVEYKDWDPPTPKSSNWSPASNSSASSSNYVPQPTSTEHFTPYPGAYPNAQAQSYSPQYMAMTVFPPHAQPMYYPTQPAYPHQMMYNPQARFLYPQGCYPGYSVPATPTGPLAVGPGYPALSPEWQLPYQPAVQPQRPRRPVGKRAVPAPFLLIEKLEMTERSKLHDEEGVEMQDILHQQIKLALKLHVLPPPPRERDADSHASEAWAEETLGRMLTEGFPTPHPSPSPASYPPSYTPLSEAPALPFSPAPASESSHGRASPGGPRLDEERYRTFRQQFAGPGAPEASTLDSPPTSWSPAHIAEAAGKEPATRSPGLTPSPADWWHYRQSSRSSPTSLAFADWGTPPALAEAPDHTPDPVP